MIRFGKSELLGREIRQDDPADLAIPTWDLTRVAMKAGKIDEALKLLDYGIGEIKPMHHLGARNVYFAHNWIVNLAGEEELHKLLRADYGARMRALLERIKTVEDTLHMFLEFHRGHFSELTVTEEPDRYVVKLDPCGTGGQLKRDIIKDKDMTKTKKAYPWSWSKSGIPLYCLHCCIGFEQIPTEIRGYPLLIAEIAERPEDPCYNYFYKKPELIPEEYFTRIGMTKTIK